MADKPPYDATVENIKYLCRELRDVSGMGEDELEEETDDLQGSTFTRNLDAAVDLGLFEETDGEYSPTTKGKQIGYERLSDEEEREMFRELVRNYSFYVDLLEIVGQELTSRDDEQFLERDVVQSEIGINFDFGVGDRTLESAAATFLKLLSACGVGDYKQGRKGYPTRLVVNEEYSEFLSSLSKSEKGTEETKEIEKEEDESQGLENQSEDGTEHSKDEQEAEIDDEAAALERMGGENSIKTEGGVVVNIDIQISSSEWDNNDVIEFISALKNKE